MIQKLVPDVVTDWLGRLDQAGDKLLLRNAYIDLCEGDHLAALIFSQILYWHLPDKSGTGSKLRVHKDGEFWLARTYKDWMNVCRIKEDTAEVRINWLKQKGLVVTKRYMFNGFRTLHLRIDFDRFAARLQELNLLRPVGEKDSDRRPVLNPDRSVEITPTGQPDRPQPITETTSTTTTAKSRTTPKSSPDEDFSDSFRDVGSNDWLALARADPTSELILTLFPGDDNTPLKSKDVARKFVKRRGTILGGNRPLLLAKMFHKARFEGTVAPDWKHCRTFSALLEPRNLDPALQACRIAAQEDLEEVLSLIDSSTDVEAAIHLIGFYDDKITPEIDLVSRCFNCNHLLVYCALAYENHHPQLAEMQRVYTEEIKESMTRELYWNQMYGGRYAEVFGVDENEIKQAQQTRMANLNAEKTELEKLLQ